MGRLTGHAHEDADGISPLPAAGARPRERFREPNPARARPRERRRTRTRVLTGPAIRADPQPAFTAWAAHRPTLNPEAPNFRAAFGGMGTTDEDAVRRFRRTTASDFHLVLNDNEFVVSLSKNVLAHPGIA
jgi:hypothetical protein